MMRRFLTLFCLIFFAGACLAQDSDVLDYRNIGPKEQAAGHMKRLTDPDGSVRRDGATLLSREVERTLPELGITPSASAFLSEVGAGLSALLLTESATVRVRAERIMDQLVAGFVSASTSKEEATKNEGVNGLKFLAQRVQAEEARIPISNALKKLKIEMPAFDEAVARQYDLPKTAALEEAPPPVEAAAAPAAEVSVTIPAEPPATAPATVVEEAAQDAKPFPLTIAPAVPEAAPAPAVPEVPPAAPEAPKSSSPRKIVVRSLAGGVAKAPVVAAPSTQVITVSLKDLKKSSPQKNGGGPSGGEASTPTEKDISSQDRVVLKLLLEKLGATDEQGKLVGIEFAHKLIDTMLKAKDSSDAMLKGLATDDMLAVRRLIGDPSASVRAEAVEIAAAFKDIEAVPLLIQRLEDQDSKVREAAHVALVSLTGKDMGQEAAKWLEKPPAPAPAVAQPPAETTAPVEAPKE